MVSCCKETAVHSHIGAGQYKTWTLHSRRRRKGRRHVSGCSESDSDGSKVDVSCSRLVRYEVRYETPELTVCLRGPAIWIPINAMAVNLEEPIAARTRSKSNT